MWKFLELDMNWAAAEKQALGYARRNNRPNQVIGERETRTWLHKLGHDYQQTGPTRKEREGAGCLVLLESLLGWDLSWIKPISGCAEQGWMC